MTAGQTSKAIKKEGARTVVRTRTERDTYQNFAARADKRAASASPTDARPYTHELDIDSSRSRLQTPDP